PSLSETSKWIGHRRPRPLTPRRQASWQGGLMPEADLYLGTRRLGRGRSARRDREQFDLLASFAPSREEGRHSRARSALAWPQRRRQTVFSVRFPNWRTTKSWSPTLQPRAFRHLQRESRSRNRYFYLGSACRFSRDQDHAGSSS